VRPFRRPSGALEFLPMNPVAFTTGYRPSRAPGAQLLALNLDYQLT
jgi:hypothetical protein